MAEPTDETTCTLLEIHSDLRALDAKIGALEATFGHHQTEITDQISRFQKVIAGESVLGCYAVAAVEKRLTSLENRLSKLEQAS